MIPEESGSAAPHERQPWDARTLSRARRVVAQLQRRIVQAVRQGKGRKVQALQHLLTHSRSAKILAVLRVTENDGSKSPGVDGTLWTTPEQKREAVDTLRQRGYRPLPLRRVYIPKKNGKLRPLGIPTMRDRAMQALYLLALDPVAETVADPHSYGFRHARSCHDALEQCHTVLSCRGAAPWVLEGDIKACFDRISHAWLLDHIPMCRATLRKWLKAGYLEHADWYPTEEGTPQGGIISPVLANMALDGLQRRLLQAFPKTSRFEAKVNLIRYADDFVITGRSREQLEREVRPLVVQFLAARGLELSPEKTMITAVTDGFDFLGQHVRRYGKKVLLKPSDRAVQTFYAGLRQVVRKSLHQDPAVLIPTLNAKIKGWANYHRHACSKATFQKLDYLIFGLLRQWTRRRHPKKSRTWIRRRYFTTVGGDHWVFFGWDHSKRESRKVLLVSASATRIRRHIKVRSELNAHAPEWQEYLQQRRHTQAARGYPVLSGTASSETAALQRAAQAKAEGATSADPKRARPRLLETRGGV